MSAMPPPMLPPIPPPAAKKSRAKIAAIIVVAIVLIGVLGTYFFVLAPRISVLDWDHTEVPLPTQNITVWQYTFDVVVANSGYLKGQTLIVCVFSFEYNSSGVPITKTHENSLKVELRGGEQAEFTVQVLLPGVDAIASWTSQDKNWSVHLE